MQSPRDSLHEVYTRIQAFNCSMIKACDVDDTWGLSKPSVHEIARTHIVTPVLSQILFQSDVHLWMLNNTKQE